MPNHYEQKYLTSVKNHQNLMRGFEDIGSKGHFSAKRFFWANPPSGGGKREFFSEIRLEHFFSLAKMQLCAKFQKNLTCGSPDIASRTHARTHGRTNERESIGPSANAERPISVRIGMSEYRNLYKSPIRMLESMNPGQNLKRRGYLKVSGIL